MGACLRLIAFIEAVRKEQKVQNLVLELGEIDAVQVGQPSIVPRQASRCSATLGKNVRRTSLRPQRHRQIEQFNGV